MGKKRGNAAIKLEKIIGTTVKTSYGLSTNKSNGDIAYCAGNTIVIYDYNKNKQTKFLELGNATTCVEFSNDGKFIAVGSGSNSEPAELSIFSGFHPYKKITKNNNTTHINGIRSVVWSPNGEMLLTIGREEDPSIKLWTLYEGELTLVVEKRIDFFELWGITKPKKFEEREKIISKKKYEREIQSISFSKDNSFFAIGGDRFLSCFAVLQSPDGRYKIRSHKIKGKKFIPLTKLAGKKFMKIESYLYEVEKKEKKSKKKRIHDGNDFYAITEDGYVVLFGRYRVEKWVNLNPQNKKSGSMKKLIKGYSLNVCRDVIVCGIGEAIVRFFKPSSFQYILTLPKPPSMDSHFTDITTAGSITQKPNSKIDYSNQNPVALKYYENDKKLVVIYSDNTFFVWDVRNKNSIAKARSFLAHHSSIWDIDMINTTDGPLPENTFATCSDDKTIRFWNIDSLSSKKKNKKTKQKRNIRQSIAKENVYCRDLIHIIKLEGEEDEIPSDQDNRESMYIERSGIRTINFSPDYSYIASGDKKGAIRIHDLYKFEPIYSELAHESEVLCMDFANTKEKGNWLLASGSRDKHIHCFLFSEDRGCEVLNTLNEHTSSITGVKFAKRGKRLISTSADQSIVFRAVNETSIGFDFKEYSTVKLKNQGKLYSLDNEPTEKYIVTTGADKEIKIWDIEAAEIKRNYRVDRISNIGDPITVKTDPSGMHTVTACTDNTLRLDDFYNGDCYAKFNAHSQIVTGIRFTNDCKRLITVGCDGLICIFKFVKSLSDSMKRRLNEIELYNQGLIATPRGRGPQKTKKERIAEMLKEQEEKNKKEQERKLREQQEQQKQMQMKILKKKEIDSVILEKEKLKQYETLKALGNFGGNNKVDSLFGNDEKSNMWDKNIDDFDLPEHATSIDGSPSLFIDDKQIGAQSGETSSTVGSSARSQMGKLVYPNKIDDDTAGNIKIEENTTKTTPGTTPASTNRTELGDDDLESNTEKTSELNTTVEEIQEIDADEEFAHDKEILDKLYSPSQSRQTKYGKRTELGRKSITELFMRKKEQDRENELKQETEIGKHKIPERLSFQKVIGESPRIKKMKSIVNQEIMKSSKEFPEIIEPIMPPSKENIEHEFIRSGKPQGSVGELEFADELTDAENDLQKMRERLKFEEEERKRKRLEEEEKKRKMEEKAEEEKRELKNKELLILKNLQTQPQNNEKEESFVNKNLADFQESMKKLDEQRKIKEEIEKERKLEKNGGKIEEKPKTPEKKHQKEAKEEKKEDTEEKPIEYEDITPINDLDNTLEIKKIDETIELEEKDENAETHGTTEIKINPIEEEDEDDTKIKEKEEEKENEKDLSDIVEGIEDVEEEINKTNEFAKTNDILPESSKNSPFKPSFKRNKLLKPTPSIRLSRSVSDYQKAIMNLRNSFSTALNCFNEVNQEVRKSRIMQPGFQEDEVTSSLLKGFTDVFKEINERTGEGPSPNGNKKEGNENGTDVRKSLIGPNYKLELQRFSVDLMKVFQDKVTDFINEKTKDL